MRRATHWSLVLIVHLATGCSKEPPQASSGFSANVLTIPPLRVAAKTANVVSATVLIERGTEAPVSIPFAGAQEARNLEDMFRGLRDGTRSQIYGAWIAYATVEFRYDDGSVERILTDFEDWKDSEGRESLVAKGTAEHIAEKRQLLEVQTRTRVLQMRGE